MKLFELFDGNDQLEKIDPSQYREYRVDGQKSVAYLLPYQGKDFIFCFECMNTGEYDFYFYFLNDHKIIFDIQNNGLAFKIIPAAVEAIKRFLAEQKPKSISFSGWGPSHDKLYDKMVKFLAGRLPKDYFLQSNGKVNWITYNPSMKDKIKESAIADTDTASKAKDIAEKFLTYIAKNNEEKSISEIMHYRSIRNYSYFYLSGAEFGAPDNLNIGFIQGLDSPASLFQGLDTGVRPPKVLYLVALSLKNDPSQETDLIYKLRWNETVSNLVHEITHYFDRERQKKPVQGTLTGKIKPVPYSAENPEAYYNSPLEFNAYFQQGVHDLMTDKNLHPDFLKDFGHFKTRAKICNFNTNWIDALTPENKKKFERRLYKLWELLRAKQEKSGV